MANSDLTKAKSAKKDEFYTQYADIQKEMNAYIDYDSDVFRGKTILLPCDDPEWSNFTKFFAQNFERFGIKKLISTSYATESKKIKDWQPTLFETESPFFDEDRSKTHGKIFVLDEDINNDGRFNIEDLKWRYLEGDGDFRSEEVRRLRDEADIIVTNPPFSLFREFVAWIMEAGKRFVCIGHQNAITYKEIFPYIKNNLIWLGKGFAGNATHFKSIYQDVAKAGDHKAGMIRVSGVVWFTNIEHGKRHEPLNLMTMDDNILYSKHKEVKNIGYMHYENYDAIEVPFSDAIPSDYDGIMGVPITFLDKYCPEQYEILECHEPSIQVSKLINNPGFVEYKSRQIVVNGILCQKTYHRIFIRKKQQ